MDRGGAKLLVISAVSTVALTAGSVTFFVAHPEGRRMFNSFLEAAAGNASPVRDEPTTEPPAPVTLAPVKLDTPAPPNTINPEAVEFLRKARQAIAANDLDAAEVAARAALVREPEYKEAQELLETIPSLRAHAGAARTQASHDAAIEAARQFLANEDLDKAESWGKKALDALPESPKALSLLTDVAKARERRIREQSAQRARADDIAREGTQALAAGEYDTAIAKAEAALKLDPENAAATFLKTQAQLARRKAAEEAAAAAAAAAAAKAAADKAENVTDEPAGPVVLDGFQRAAPASTEPQPVTLDIPPTPITIDVGTSDAVPPAPVVLAPRPDGASLSDDAQALIVALAKLDKALETEDVRALDRLLSVNYIGVQTRSGRTSKADEIANAAAFFGIASAIKVTRTTYEKDVQVIVDEAKVRSQQKIAYTLQGMPLGRTYTALYGFVREKDGWRISSMLTEQEGP